MLQLQLYTAAVVTVLYSCSCFSCLQLQLYSLAVAVIIGVHSCSCYICIQLQLQLLQVYTVAVAVVTCVYSCMIVYHMSLNNFARFVPGCGVQKLANGSFINVFIHGSIDERACSLLTGQM